MPYIVRLIGTEEDTAPAKRFEDRHAARRYAEQVVVRGDAERAEILNDKLEFLEPVGARATAAEAQSAFDRAWKKAESDGDTAAQLKLLGL